MLRNSNDEMETTTTRAEAKRATTRLQMKHLRSALTQKLQLARCELQQQITWKGDEGMENVSLDPRERDSKFSASPLHQSRRE